MSEQTTDYLQVEPTHERASTGKRFANYIIDLVIFYILIFCLSFGLTLMAPAFMQDLVADDSNSIMLNIAALLLYVLYMSALEALTKGKTIGKFITGTRAVNLDGTAINTSKAFGRGLSRAVPFCAFSALGTPCNPWQDKWTNTMVIDEKKTVIS